MKKLMLVAIMILLAVTWNAYASEDLTLEEGSANFVDPRYGIAMIGAAQRTDAKELYTPQKLKEFQERMASTDTPAGSVSGAASPNATEGEGLRATMANAGEYSALPAIQFQDYNGYVWTMRTSWGAITPEEHNQYDTQLDQLEAQQAQIAAQQQQVVSNSNQVTSQMTQTSSNMNFLSQYDQVSVYVGTDTSPEHYRFYYRIWSDPSSNYYYGKFGLSQGSLDPNGVYNTVYYPQYINNNSTIYAYRQYESQYSQLQSQSSQLQSQYNELESQSSQLESQSSQLETQLNKPVTMSSSEYMALQNAQLAAHQREEEQHQVQFQQDTKAQNDITCLRY